MNALMSLAGPLLCLAAGVSQAVDLPDLPRPPVPSTYRQGTQAFRRLLPGLGFTEPLKDLQDLENRPERKLLVVLGNTTAAERVPGGIDTFLNEGGAVLIATDRGAQGGWADVLGVRIDGRFVRYTGELGADQEIETPPLYGGQEFPYVLATANSPLFSGMKRLATNRPSFLQITRTPGQPGPRLMPMARFVNGCAATNRREPLFQIQPHAPYFAAGGNWGQGRVLVLADHSVFINEMLLRTDNENLQFAGNCLRWLNELSQRNQVLFVEEGTVATNFQEPFDIPTPPPQALVPLINSALRGLEEENAFNAAILGQVPFDRLLLWVLGLVTLILVGYGFLRLSKRRHRVDRETPRLAPLLARQAPSPALVELRHQAMLEEGNVWEAARALARQCFDGALGHGSQAEMSLLAAEWGEPPHVIVSGGWWRRWQLGQRVRFLWQLAYDAVPVAVSPREFTRLEAEVRELRQELADGTVRIEPPALA